MEYLHGPDDQPMLCHHSQAGSGRNELEAESHGLDQICAASEQIHPGFVTVSNCILLNSQIHGKMRTPTYKTQLV